MMSRLFSARFLSLTTLGGLLVAGTVPASAVAAETTAKPLTVTLSASALKDETSKLCMPRTMIDKSRKSTLPKTICQTRAEWAEQGVNIVAK